LKGKISYRVIKVTSTFKSGKFTQVLDCVITTFPNDPAPANQAPANQAPANQAPASRNTSVSQVTQTQGLEPNALDPEGQIFVGTGTAADERARFNPASQEVTRRGTANDDAVTRGNNKTDW
jgi:hypothetical protein